jgi:dTDP-4-amino-4,6-dideoxygalactose transaminase
MMKVPFVDLRGQYETISDEVFRELKEVCETSQFVVGPKVHAFEEAFASSSGALHCVGLNSGTSALHVAMRCLDVGPGDEVITVPMTFIATVWGILYCGATPVFVDVHPTTRTLDAGLLEAAITSHTRAILPVHLYGQAADLGPIQEIAGRHGIPVVEDAAQAHGALYRGQTVGAIGRMGCFSFYPGKNLGAYGEAGALVTNDPAVAARARRLRDHGQADRYYHDEVGYNYRMEAFQAAVLRVKLRHLPHWTMQRQRIASLYRERLLPLAGAGHLDIPEEPIWSKGVYHLYVVLVDDRDRVRHELDQAGIGTGLHYPVPLHLQKALAYLGRGKGDFPVAEAIAARCLSLPIFPEMREEQVDVVVQALVRALRI